MCGINGIYSNGLVNNHMKRIDEMNRSIQHRGPDSRGSKHINDKISLGHQRLSIIDLDSRSDQPMLSNSGDTALVYNGEIFNFHEIKKELINEYNFKTNSDTEVLLAGYEVRGLDWLLNVINGMFAFAIYDIKKNELFLIRDRFGIKPLFFTCSNDTIIFSSEIKGILSSGLIEPEFNEKAIDDYLGYRYVREPNTFFKEIYQVKSSTYIKVKNGRIVGEQSYWSLPKLNFSKKFNETEIITETKNEVRNAIKKWLIADVKVGSYLSGGVDSSLTTAILSQEHGSEVNTYTIGFKEEGFNEFEHARVVADLYKTKHHEILLDQNDYLEEWTSLVKFKDAPLAVPNEIPLAKMSTSLSKDITVVISGEGADELFGGYGRIYRSSFDYINHEDKSEDFYNYFINKYEYVPRELRDQCLKVGDHYRHDFDLSLKESFTNFSNEENIFRFFHNGHITGLLNRVDVTTMQTSVEARPPFLDHKLIEFVYQEVPYDLKLKWKSGISKKSARSQLASQYSEILDTPKYALKKVSEEYLPSSIIYRKKMGFPVPLTKWFPKLTQMANNLLSDATWLNNEKLNELIMELERSNDSRIGQILWMFINIEIFKREYFNKKYIW